MKYPKILVTGATGKTGRALVDELLAKDVPVRAVVHSKDARSAALERKGAETVVADMFDFDQLLAAMRGTERLLSSLL
jgi:NAD(P)H dehydrogenase (quinone)